jgi:hypothetical protein
MAIQGSLHENFVWLELIGFILLVIGTLVYNEILILPFWGFDKNTKIAHAKKNKTEYAVIGGVKVALKQDVDYMNTSPHAGYDANRNKRILKKKMNEEATKDEKDEYEIQGDITV